MKGTQIIMSFDITNPKEVKMTDINCKNNYKALGMLDVAHNRKTLHEVLDKCLDEINAELFKNSINDIQRSKK
jgi:hypothetical protein